MSKVELSYAVLLKDGHGYKEEMKDELTPVMLKQGSLLKYLDSLVVNRIKEKYDFLVNFKLVDTGYHSEVFFFAAKSSVFYITSLQRDFLLGIERLHRISVLNRLQWVESLTVGSDVYVTIAATPTPVKGIIRYIGEVPGDEGRNFGVELMERRGDGTCNGTIKNRTFFECDKGCAVFVAMDKLTSSETVQAAMVTKTNLPVYKPSVTNDDSFIVSDHVVFYDKFTNLVRGTVESIGPTLAEIKVEGDVSLDDIPGCINFNKHKQCFTPREPITVFISITYVTRDSSRTNSTHPTDQNMLSHSGHNHLLTKGNKYTSTHHSTVGSAVQYICSKSNDTGDRPRDSASGVQLVDTNPYNLEVGSVIQYGEPAQCGVIKWIGKLPGQEEIYAGVEMENTVDNCTDGTFEGIQYFISDAGRGKFVKLHELQPDKRYLTNGPSLEFGSTVQCGDPGKVTQTSNSSEGIEDCARVQVEDGKSHGFIPPSALQLDSRHVDNTVNESHHIEAKYEVGSLIQFGNPVKYGVIKRIEGGDRTSIGSAEVEMENGKYKKVSLDKIQLDKRFSVDVNDIEGKLNPLEKECYRHDEKAPHVPPNKKFDKHKHTSTKGIQGYKNSCYLDATLYGMFTFSDAFDVLLRGEITANPEDLRLQKMLKSDIVYPLRKKGIVVQESVEAFREHLAKLQNMKGLTSEEKDPEEFLNLLFKHVLYLEPFVIIRRPSGVDKEFFIQLFVEPDEDMPSVNTQSLLNRMFNEQNISFLKCPAKLLLQMPRYGKRFKSFKHIIPSLELDVASLCHTTGSCSIYNQPEGYVSTQYDTCSSHQHQNCDHNFQDPDLHNTGTLQLLSVLCIETSHYVCFTRIIRSGKDEWVFFDSMAERQDSGYNLPKVTHCTDQLKKYVYGKKDINKIPSTELPDLARRFVQDAYLCIYVDHDRV